VDALKTATKVDAKEFAFDFAASPPTIDIGIIRTAAYPPTATITWIDVLDSSFYWSNNISGIKFSTSGQDEWGLIAKPAIIDSTAYSISVPSEDFDWFMENVAAQTIGYYTDKDYGTVVECEHRTFMPSLKVLLGGFWLEIRPEDYLLEIADTKECYIAFKKSADETWVLGSTFMRGYYTTFNMETQKFGFVPTATSLKKLIEAGETPARVRELDVGLVVGFSVASAVMIGLIAFIFI